MVVSIGTRPLTSMLGVRFSMYGEVSSMELKFENEDCDMSSWLEEATEPKPAYDGSRWLGSCYLVFRLHALAWLVHTHTRARARKRVYPVCAPRGPKTLILIDLVP